MTMRMTKIRSLFVSNCPLRVICRDRIKSLVYDFVTLVGLLCYLLCVLLSVIFWSVTYWSPDIGHEQILGHWQFVINIKILPCDLILTDWNE